MFDVLSWFNTARALFGRLVGSVLAYSDELYGLWEVFWSSSNQTMQGSTGGLHYIRLLLNILFDLRFIITDNKKWCIYILGFVWERNEQILKGWDLAECLHVFCSLSEADMIMHHAAHGPKIQEGLWTCCGLGKRRIQWNYVQQSSRRSCDLIIFIYIYI